MKKIILSLLCLLIGTTGFAANFVLDNQSPYPAKNQKSKVAIQWATSVKDTTENNRKVMQGLTLNPNSLQTLTQTGKIHLTIPQKAEYFRVLIWSKGTGAPDLLTNWVAILPSKTYTLNEDHLTPVILMSGTGC